MMTEVDLEALEVDDMTEEWKKKFKMEWFEIMVTFRTLKLKGNREQAIMEVLKEIGFDL